MQRDFTKLTDLLDNAQEELKSIVSIDEKYKKRKITSDISKIKGQKIIDVISANQDMFLLTADYVVPFKSNATHTVWIDGEYYPGWVSVETQIKLGLLTHEDVKRIEKENQETEKELALLEKIAKKHGKKIINK